MEEVWKQVTTPVFWICTIAASMLVSIIMHFFLRMLDQRFGTWSKARKERQEAEEIELKANLYAFLQYNDFRALLIARSSIKRFYAAFFLIGGSISYLLGMIIAMAVSDNSHKLKWLRPIFYFFTIFSILFFVKGMKILREAGNLNAVVNMAYNIERKRLIEEKEQENSEAKI